jgi:hypothetical protein
MDNAYNYICEKKLFFNEYFDTVKLAWVFTIEKISKNLMVCYMY